MVLFCNILKNIRLNRLFIRFVRPYHFHDRYLEYFRNANGYQNSLMQINNDFVENKLILPEISSITKDKDMKIDEFLNDLMQREKVQKLSKAELKGTMYLMANSEIDSAKYELVLKHIDERCALNVDRWPLHLSLYMLDAWFSILGPKVFRNHYYCALTNLLNKKMKKCSKFDLILVLHFIGLSKHSPPFLMELIKYKMEQFAPQFSDEEWAAASLSFYKTSTKMDSNLLLQHCCKAAENLMLKNDRFHLISILKCFRLSEYLDSDLMSNLTKFIKREYTTFNFVECTNFLAAYATRNIYDFEIYKHLEDQGMALLLKEDSVVKFDKDIGKIHPSERIRVKDIGRFLWGLSFVAHDVNPKSISFLVDMINMRIESGEFELQMPVLIDCLQSLILLGHYPTNIIAYALHPNSLQKISNITKAKPKYQLYFIDRSAYLENCITEINKKKHFKNIPKNLEKEIFNRKGYQDLISYLNIYMKEDLFRCCYIMPHIMISGIFVASNPKKTSSNNLITANLLKLIEDGVISKSIQDILHEDKVYTAIELLDSSVCAEGSTRPLGLLKTKMHHLQKLNINVITLSPEEIFASSSKLQDLVA